MAGPVAGADVASSAQPKDLTARLMAYPLGRRLVALIGIGLLAAGAGLAEHLAPW
jgi:hypothetical protein